MDHHALIIDNTDVLIHQIPEAFCFQGLPSMDSMRGAMRFSPTGYVYNLPSANTVTAVGREVNLSSCYLTWQWNYYHGTSMTSMQSNMCKLMNSFCHFRLPEDLDQHFMDVELELYGSVWDLLCMCAASPDSLPILPCLLFAVKEQSFERCYKRHFLREPCRWGVNNGLTAECNWDPVLFDSFRRAWRGSSMADDCIRVAADASSAASAP